MCPNTTQNNGEEAEDNIDRLVEWESASLPVIQTVQPLYSRLQSIIFEFFCSLSIEPIFIFFIVGGCIVPMVVQTYYIDRFCRINEGMSPDICQNLSRFPDLEQKIQQKISRIFIYQILIETGTAIFFALFLGPLTDKYGFKPLILLSISGYILNIILLVGSYFLPLMPAKYLLLASIPIGISGGSVLFAISTIGYLSFHVSNAQRSFRLSGIHAVWNIGQFIGFPLGNIVLNNGGFLSLFLFSLLFYLISFTYTLILLREEKPERNDLLLSSSQSFFSDVISLSPLKEMFQSCLKRRSGYRRLIIMLAVTGIGLKYLCHASFTSVLYLFTRNRFGWDTTSYSEYASFDTLMGSIGTFITMLIFIQLFKFSDSTILIIDGVTGVVTYFIISFSQYGWHLYSASVVRMFSNTATPIFKSVISKSANDHEYGKLISVAACVGYAMPFVGGPMFTFLYAKTVVTFPGLVFLIAAGVSGALFFTAGVLRVLTAADNTVEHSRMVDSEQERED